MRLDVFADLFVARDGDATTASLVILAAVFGAIVLAFGVMCWMQRRHLREFVRRYGEAERRQDEQVAHLGQTERQLEGVVHDMRSRILTDWGNPKEPERRLKCLKGGAA